MGIDENKRAYNFKVSFVIKKSPFLNRWVSSYHTAWRWSKDLLYHMKYCAIDHANLTDCARFTQAGKMWRWWWSCNSPLWFWIRVQNPKLQNSSCQQWHLAAFADYFTWSAGGLLLYSFSNDAKTISGTSQKWVSFGLKYIQLNQH